MNRKTVSLLCCAIVMLVFAGCATTPETNADGSPYWTTHTPKQTRRIHYEVGMAKQSTMQLSQLRAESAAKDAIGRWASTTVDNALVTFVEESGELLKTQQMLSVLQNLSVQTVSIALREVSVVERYVAPDGTVWVLSSYPVNNLEDAYRLQAEALEAKLESEKAAAQAIDADVMLAYLQTQLDSESDSE
jgi:hypothetical protein